MLLNILTHGKAINIYFIKPNKNKNKKCKKNDLKKT